MRRYLLRPALVLLATTFAICSLSWHSDPAAAAVGPGENPVELRLAAMEAVLRGDTSGALDLFNTAIQEANRQYGGNSTFLADLYYEAGSVALDASQFGPAEHYLTEAVKANPYSTMAKLKLAELYRVQDRSGDAALQFKQAVQVNPNSAVTKHAYIRWLILNGSSPNEQALANAEALRLAMLRSRTEAYLKNIGPQPTRSTPAKGTSAETKPSRESETNKTKPGNTDHKPEKSQDAVETNGNQESKGPSLFPFRSIKDTKSSSEKSKAQKAAAEKAAQKAQEAAQKAEEERNKAAAKFQEEAARRQKQARAEKEKADRQERERLEQAKHAQSKAEKPKAAKPKETKPVEPRVEQPAVVPSPAVAPMQPVYPMPGFMLNQPKPNAKRGLVPPPPPAPIPVFGGMPMMQQPPITVPKTSPKPSQKPKETSKEAAPKESPKEAPAKETAKETKKEAPPKEQVEEKSSDVDPEFLLDWSGTEKKKKGR